MKRWVTVRGRTSREIAAYLPDNYTIVDTSPNPTGVDVVIEGEDVAGWTLDGYVIPRLASGLFFAREHASYADANEAAAAAMN